MTFALSSDTIFPGLVVGGDDWNFNYLVEGSAIYRRTDTVTTLEHQQILTASQFGWQENTLESTCRAPGQHMSGVSPCPRLRKE